MRDEDFTAYYEDGDFAKFARATRSGWERLARMILSRWTTPAEVGVEDLVQEMLVACWYAVCGGPIVKGCAIKRWCEGRGPSLRSYATYHAIDKARKFVHRRRKAGHAGGAGPSRFEISEAGRHHRSIFVDRMPVDGAQEREAAHAQLLERAGPARVVVEVFERFGSLDAAAGVILERQVLRELSGARRFPEARAAARRMIEALVKENI